MSIDLDFFSRFKDYLSERPEYAFLGLSVMTNVYLFFALIKCLNSKLDLVLQWLPLADKMASLLNTMLSSKRKPRSDVDPKPEK